MQSLRIFLQVSGVLVGVGVGVGVVGSAGCSPPPETVSADSDGAGGVLEEVNASLGQRAAAPRLIAPLSTTHQPTKTPLLSWLLPRPATSARVDICSDRACRAVLQSFQVAGESARPPAPLPDGAVFWRVTALGPGRRASQPSATWEMWPTGMNFPQPGLDGPPADAPWGSVLDVNADGFADLAVGAPGETAGFVHLFLGRAGQLGPVPSQTLDGAGCGAAGAPQFGGVVSSAGDVNGDGFADLAVTTGVGEIAGMVETSPGSVQLFYGGPQGLRRHGSTTLQRGPVTRLFGRTLSTAGDVDGDGYSDLLVGGDEVAQVYRGGPDGIATAAAFALRGSDVDPTESPSASTARGGADVSGDRHPDVMVEGHTYLGTGNGFVLQPGSSFEQNSLSGDFAGDVNGDGLSDFAGGVVLLGTANGLGTEPFRVIDGAATFAGAGDVNRDGFAEVLFFTPGASFPNEFGISYGSPLGCPQGNCGLPQNPLAIRNSFLGMAWAAAGDLNGDRNEDIAVGSATDNLVHIVLGPVFQGLDVPVPPSYTIAGVGTLFGASVE